MRLPIPALAIVTLLTMPLIADQSAIRPGDERLPWHQLTLTASKLFVSATTSIILEHDVLPEVSSEELWRIDVDSKVVGRRSQSSVWFGLGDAAAVQRTKRRFGSKSYHKTYRFSPSGVHSQRRSPAGPEELELPPQQWTRGYEQTFSLPASAIQRCEVISEPTTLLALVPLRGLDEDLDLCVFSSKSWHRVTTKRLGESTIEARFAVRNSAGHSPGTSELEHGSLQVIDISIRGEPLDDQSSEPLELLGLEGDVVISMEPERHLPIEVRGRMPVLGAVRVRLDEVVLH